MIHWVRPGKRFSGVSKEEMKSISEEEAKNNLAIFVGIRNSKVDLSSIKCLKLDEKSSSKAWVNEYFLVDSEDKNITVNDQNVKVQSRVPTTMSSKKKQKKKTDVKVEESVDEKIQDEKKQEETPAKEKKYLKITE
eukprot:UN32920